MQTKMEIKYVDIFKTVPDTSVNASFHASVNYYNQMRHQVTKLIIRDNLN